MKKGRRTAGIPKSKPNLQKPNLQIGDSMDMRYGGPLPLPPKEPGKKKSIAKRILDWIRGVFDGST